MTGYTITLPTFADTDNLQFSANVADSVFKFIARWYDNLWHMTIFLDEGNKRSCIVYPNAIYFKYDTTYSMMFVTELTEIGYNDLSGLSLEVAIGD